MKKISVFLACLVLFSGAVLFAGGQGQQGSAASGADPYANLPMEVSITMLDRGAVPASEGSYENNRWTRWANEHAPVKINYVPINRGQSFQLIYSLFAAGTAPDIVWEYSKDLLDNLYDQGVIMPLDDLIEKYSVTYKQFQKDHPDILPYLRAEDGKQYGVTSLRKMVPAPWGGIWIRQDWLDKFGMSPPKNTAEVVTFLRRVRDEDPDGNGQKDTFGIGGSVNPDFFLPNIRSLFGAPHSNILIENGRFLDWTESSGYRDYLDFVAMIYREGFVDPEFITDSQGVRQRQLLVTGKTGMYLFSHQPTAEWRELKTNIPSASLVPLEPWTTSQGKFGLYTDPLWMKMVCINKDARNPKAAMAFLDWSLTTEAWMTMTYGLEGVHYQLANGEVPQAIDAAKNQIEISYLHGNTEFLPLTQVVEKPEWYPIMAAKDPLSQEFARMVQKQVADITMKLPFRRLVPYGPTSETIRQYNADVGAQIGAIETDIYTGKVSVDAGLKQINDLKKAAGWDRIKAEIDAWLQTNKTNFGL
jgi:putative aldouronate transport system substrate-binding protein